MYSENRTRRTKQSCVLIQLSKAIIDLPKTRKKIYIYAHEHCKKSICTLSKSFWITVFETTISTATTARHLFYRYSRLDKNDKAHRKRHTQTHKHTNTQTHTSTHNEKASPHDLLESIVVVVTIVVVTIVHVGCQGWFLAYRPPDHGSCVLD
jgi:hypothetical protein